MRREAFNHIIFIQIWLDKDNNKNLQRGVLSSSRLSFSSTANVDNDDDDDDDNIPL